MGQEQFVAIMQYIDSFVSMFRARWPDSEVIEVKIHDGIDNAIYPDDEGCL